MGSEMCIRDRKENKGLRDQLEIVTKCDIVAPAGRHASARVKHYDTSPGHIAASIDHSLTDIGTEYIDMLLIHRPDPLMDHVATGRTLDDAVASGKVRAIGVSNFRPWDWSLLQSAMETPLATNQIEISLAAHKPLTNGDIAFLQEKNVAPMAWSPLGGGALMSDDATPNLRAVMARIAKANNVDTSTIAVAWLLAHPIGILPVMGTNTIARIKTLSEAMNVTMDRQSWFELYEAALGREVA